MFVRPNIGWLGFVVLRQYPLRTALLVGLVIGFGLVCMREAQHTLTLQYDQPSRFPPPVMVLARADQPNLTPLDACGVEAASLAVQLPSLLDVGGPFVRHNVAQDKEVENLLKDLRDHNPLNELKRIRDARTDDQMDNDVEVSKLSRLSKKHGKKVDALEKKIQQMIDNNENAVDDFNIVSLERSDIEKDLESKSLFAWSKYKEQRRTVSVYLWGTTVFKGDEWAHFVNTLPGIHLSRMDPSKALAGTPFTSWTFSAGLTRQTSWVSWTTAAAGLLWKTGGLVLPMGVVLTKPLAVTAVGTGVGVLAGSPDISGHISPLALGTKPQHDILKELIHMMVNNSEYMTALPAATDMEPDPLHALTPVSPLLTEAVKDGCGTSQIPYLYISDCGDFTLLPSTETISVDMRQNWAVPPLQTLLRYSGSAADLRNPSVFMDLFRILKLERFCPRVATEVLRRGVRDGVGL